MRRPSAKVVNRIVTLRLEGAKAKPEKFEPVCVCVCVCVCVREREREREREKVERCFGKGMDGIKSLQNPLIF